MSKSLTGVSITLEQLAGKLAKKSQVDALATMNLLKTDLVLNTPIDTGEAREGWKLVIGKNGTNSLINDVPHIALLNNGSSKQAPAHFIEMIALKYGRPVGRIITEK